MIVQFFRYGRGLSKGPIDYLLGKNRNRPYARILSGDEREVAELIDSSPYAKKYTCGCLSFYERDLTEDAKAKIMADFENCLFPGMDESQYRVLWIEHRDKENEKTGEKRLELNFLIPNTEVITGKRLQPFFHTSDLSRVDLFKKIINFEYQLHDPDDPKNWQMIANLGEKKSDPKSKRNMANDTDEIRSFIGKTLLENYTLGLVQSRQDVKDWLTDMGFKIKGEAKNSISIENPRNPNKTIRLKGAIYAKYFRTGAEGDSLTERQAEDYRREARERYEGDIQRYRSYIDRKSKELEAKYRLYEEGPADPSQQGYRRSLSQYSGKHKKHQNKPRKDCPRINRDTCATDQTVESALTLIEPLEPRDSDSGQHKKNPFYFDYGSSFSDAYFAYQRYLFGVREQDPVERDSSHRSQTTADRSHYTAEDQRVQPNHSNPIQNQGWEIDDELTSTAFVDYRRTTATAEAATIKAGRSLETYSSASWDYRRVEKLHNGFKHEVQRNDANSAEVSGNRAEARRTENIRKFFTDFTIQFTKTITATFEGVTEWLKYPEPSPREIRANITSLGAARNRKANEASSRSNTIEIGLSAVVSRQVSSFDRGGIFKALDELDRRKILRTEVVVKNYDSPSLF